jgi:hypothetical protein
MESLSQHIDLLQGSRLLRAELCASETGEDLYRVEIVFDGQTFVGVGSDCFDALIEARRHLELQEILVCVEGARKDVWPSGMARSMGAGRKAYRMTLGKQALKSDLVDVFAEALTPASIAEQEAYRHAWFESLGRAGAA